MKHDVEADEIGPSHDPCDQGEKRIKDEYSLLSVNSVSNNNIIYIR
jgi:hypothetical protein